MPISDSSPERRNLVLISVAFILFYAAGGSFDGGEIKLLVVNLQFSKPEILTISAWVLLFWFALRFYQKTHLDYRNELWSEIIKGGVSKSLSAKACKLARDQLQGANHADYFDKRVSAQDISSNGLWGISVVCNFQNGSGTIVHHQEVVELGGIQGFFYRQREVVSHTITGNAIAEHLVPYLLFVAAVLAPLWSRNV
ncbi:hypothetical protein [Thiohalomonas denitrificans]|uniref:hypothetical protein n=1 Tax=Thiohalomonas denitrificans TaxID=415747 RepID=UPI0026ED19D8|nr:hypothetical protein [Thiohalomonas denitrificans]